VFDYLTALLHRKTIILPVVLYGCETWSLTLREEHGLRKFRDRVLRRIFEAKREEVAGDWRRVHNEEFHDFYASSNMITVIASKAECSTRGKDEKCVENFVGKPERMRSFGMPRQGWEDNVRRGLVLRDGGWAWD
jgi:hypothetical protein